MGRLHLLQKIKNQKGIYKINIIQPLSINSGLYILLVNGNKEQYAVKFERL